jgi:deoxyadenosine/deoxycytidine kinase
MVELETAIKAPVRKKGLPLGIIRESRFIKEFVKEEGIVSKGSAGGTLEGIWSTAGEVLISLEKQNKDFVSRERGKIHRYLKDISESDVEESFRNGLDAFLKQQYRLLKKVSPSEVEKLNDKEYLKDTIFSYTFDFIYTLRMAEQMGIYPSTALELARLTYMHNPDIILKLTKQFPEFEIWVITHAAVSNIAPEKFLTRVQETIPNLQTKFPDFEIGIITYTAVNNPSNPEGFLQKIKDTIPKLQKQFPEFEPWVFTRAAISDPSDPEGFLKIVRQMIPDLQKKFPNAPLKLIKKALVSNPSNPVEYITRNLNGM